MNSNENQQAYDRGVSVFSPEGRIYQVEYAREAVENGSPSVGVQTENGVVLAALVSNASPLKLDDSVEKIHMIEDSLAAVTTGYLPDGRRLVENLRVTTQQDRLRYGEEPTVATVAKTVADDIQETTQVGGRRPFGASLIIGGVDEDGPSLFSVEPGGTPSEWRAVADGNRRQRYLDFFEQNYDETDELDEVVDMSLEALREVSGDRNEISGETLDVTRISTSGEQTQLTNDEVEEYLE